MQLSIQILSCQSTLEAIKGHVTNCDNKAPDAVANRASGGLVFNAQSLDGIARNTHLEHS